MAMRWNRFLRASAKAEWHDSCANESGDRASRSGGADSTEASNLLAADEIRRRQISLAVRYIAAVRAR
jgi:hypothetical protein